MVSQNHKGNVAELAIATEAARLGMSVYKPLTEHGRCDMVLGIGDQLLRIQCKWGSSDGAKITVRLTCSYLDLLTLRRHRHETTSVRR
jgi:hypothetical protein